MKMAETPSIATETQGSEVKSKEGIASKSCFLFNCDHTCSLEPAQNLLKSIEEQVGFVISPTVQRYFDLHKMADMCEDIKKASDVMDFAIFVVHANESRLSINEENAGIGYAMFYRTLMEKTGEFSLTEWHLRSALICRLELSFYLQPQLSILSVSNVLSILPKETSLQKKENISIFLQMK